MSQKKKKPRRRKCIVCGQYRTKEQFSPEASSLSICKRCEADIETERSYAEEVAELDWLSEEESDALVSHFTLESIEAKLTKPKGKKAIPYEELDANIVNLVQVLNRYPGLITVGSCGGHEEITNPSQWQAGSWYVKFKLSSDKLGWYVLEHLAWAINEDARGAGDNVHLLPTAAPPYLNTPGACLYFVIEAWNGANPDELARFLEEVRPLLTKKRQ